MVPGNRGQSKVLSIAVIAICQVAAMSLWFSASAVLPALIAEVRLSAFTQAALTVAYLVPTLQPSTMIISTATAIYLLAFATTSSAPLRRSRVDTTATT